MDFRMLNAQVVDKALVGAACTITVRCRPLPGYEYLVEEMVALLRQHEYVAYAGAPRSLDPRSNLATITIRFTPDTSPEQQKRHAQTVATRYRYFATTVTAFVLNEANGTGDIHLQVWMVGEPFEQSLIAELRRLHGAGLIRQFKATTAPSTMGGFGDATLTIALPRMSASPTKVAEACRKLGEELGIYLRQVQENAEIRICRQTDPGIRFPNLNYR